MNWTELHKFLRKQNIGFFDIQIDGEMITLVHPNPNKTVGEWRKDLRNQINIGNKDESGNAAEGLGVKIINQMIDKLGYIDIKNLVDDVFEGRTATYDAKIIDYPDHEGQKGGFGHYGWNNMDE